MQTNATSMIAASRRLADAAASDQHDQEQQTTTTSMDSPAWDLILQHDGGSIRRDVPTVCALLCCCKGMRAAASEHCAGQLDVAIRLLWQGCPAPAPAPAGFQVHPSQTEQLSAWAAKHGRLLRALDVRGATAGSQATFAAALAAAAAAGPAAAQDAAAAQEPQQQQGQQQDQQQGQQQQPGTRYAGLLLQSFIGSYSFSAKEEAALLQQLPASHLTSLTVGYSSADDDDGSSPGDDDDGSLSADNDDGSLLADDDDGSFSADDDDGSFSADDDDGSSSGGDNGMAAALIRLTGLQELEMAQPPWAALSALPHLHTLKLPFGISRRTSKHLPQLLLELHVDTDRDDEENEGDEGWRPLRLAHLTALTRLQHYDMELPLRLERTGHLYLEREHQLGLLNTDKLPPNLKALHATFTGWQSLQPLLALQQLEELGFICNGYCNDSIVAGLTALKALTELRLGFWGAFPAPAVAVLPLLPVKELVCTFEPSLPKIDMLGRLRGLTKLQLFTTDFDCSGFHGFDDGGECCAALPVALKQLTALQHLYLNLGGWFSDRDGWRQALLQAVVCLPLRSLSLCCLRCRGAFRQLQLPTTLTSLFMCECHLVDADVIVLAERLTGLRKLIVSCHKHVTSAVLPAIGGNLTQLTYLSLTDTSVADAGLHHLSSLRQLRELHLTYTQITRAGVEQQLGMGVLPRLRFLGVPW